MNVVPLQPFTALARRSLFRNWRRGQCRLLGGWLVLLLLSLTAGAETYQVNVFDYFFEPFQITIHTGDTVEWTAYGFGHTLISDTRVFDSSLVWGSSIPALRSFRFTFHEPGLYPYYSLDYGGPDGVGMSDTITVTGAVTNQIPLAPTNTFPADGAADQPIRVELRGSAFVDGDSGDVHVASEWLVRRASDQALVYDSGEVIEDGGVSASRTNRFLPNQLLHYGTRYSWQVRYKDNYGAWSANSAATLFSTLRPPLQAFRQGDIMVTAWPTNSAGFFLESSTNALAGPWDPAGASFVSGDGRNVVTNTLVGTGRIYRLHKNL